MLNPYNIKMVVYCSDDAEARRVQLAINETMQGINPTGGNILGFYSFFKQREAELRPIIMDVVKNGTKSIAKHLIKLPRILR